MTSTDSPSTYRFPAGWILPSLAILAAAASLAGYAASIIPQLDLLVHFQVQYAWVLLLILLLLLCTRRWGWAIVVTALLALPTARIAPWYLDAPPSASGPVIELLSCNVKFTNPEHRQLIELIEHVDADIVVVQEATSQWAQALSVLSGRWPHLISHPTPGPRGMLLMSRRPLQDTEVTIDPVTRHCTLLATIDVDGRSMRIIAAHPFRPGLRHGSKLLAGELERLGDLAGDDTGNLIVIGDLNTTMWSKAYTDFVEANRLSNLRQGIGILPSWHSLVPWLSAIPIDHCLVGSKLQGFDFRLRPVAGSDHDAMVAVIGFR